MKARIKDVKFQKEYDSKYGKMYSFLISYDDKKAFYNSKNNPQTSFVKGEEAEFTEETKTYTDKNGNAASYISIKPPQSQRQSNFGKALKKEQSKYSGFAVAYAKDLVVAGKLDREELGDYAWILFDLMVEMDKTIEQ